MLFDACCSLLVVCCVLFAARCLLFSVCSLLFVVRSLLCAGWRLLFVVCCSWLSCAVRYYLFFMLFCCVWNLVFGVFGVCCCMLVVV